MAQVVGNHGSVDVRCPGPVPEFGRACDKLSSASLAARRQRDIAPPGCERPAARAPRRRGCRRRRRAVDLIDEGCRRRPLRLRARGREAASKRWTISLAPFAFRRPPRPPARTAARMPAKSVASGTSTTLRPSRRSRSTVGGVGEGLANDQIGIEAQHFLGCAADEASPLVRPAIAETFGSAARSRQRGDPLARHEVQQQLVGAQVQRDDAASGLASSGICVAGSIASDAAPASMRPVPLPHGRSLQSPALERLRHPR